MEIYRSSKCWYHPPLNRFLWHKPGNGKGYSQQPRYSPFGQFTGIRPTTKFLDNEKVEGIHLVTDIDLVRDIHLRISEATKGPPNFFPAMCPVNLTMQDLHLIGSNSQTPYVMTISPAGPRFLLYIDPAGQIFMENTSQQIFRVDSDHAINIISSNGHPITDTILDGVIAREKLIPCYSCRNYTLDSQNVAYAMLDACGLSSRRKLSDYDVGSHCLRTESKTAGKLTFVIMDAIKCKGEPLLDFKIDERIKSVKEEIMKPRLNALEKGTICNEGEVFNLDIVAYKETYYSYFLAMDFLNCGYFEETYKYPLGSLLFYPSHLGYVSGTWNDVFKLDKKSVEIKNFLLKISKEPSSWVKDAELFAIDSFSKKEIFFAKIELTDEIRELDGQIIQCRYIDNCWVSANSIDIPTADDLFKSLEIVF